VLLTQFLDIVRPRATAGGSSSPGRPTPARRHCTGPRAWSRPRTTTRDAPSDVRPVGDDGVAVPTSQLPVQGLAAVAMVSCRWRTRTA